MRSNWLPWDFISSCPAVVTPGDFGLYAIRSFDPIIEKIMFDRMNRSSSLSPHFEGGRPTVISGADITVLWLEDKFQTLGLFSQNDSYLVLQAEMITADAKKALLEKSFDFAGRYFILAFSKENTFFDQLAKKVAGKYYKIDAPRFWESAKLLNFLIDEVGPTVSYDVRNYILSSVPNSCSELWRCLNLLKLYCDEHKEIELAEVKKLVANSKLDQFHLASLYGQKKRPLFFKTILETEIDFDGLRSIFSFMQGHLMKMADTSYIRKKARPSKYDKEIDAHSKLWNRNELQVEMRLFGELEIEAKKQTPLLISKIREAYLASYKV